MYAGNRITKISIIYNLTIKKKKKKIVIKTNLGVKKVSLNSDLRPIILR